MPKYRIIQTHEIVYEVTADNKEQAEFVFENEPTASQKMISSTITGTRIIEE